MAHQVMAVGEVIARISKTPADEFERCLLRSMASCTFKLLFTKEGKATMDLMKQALLGSWPAQRKFFDTFAENTAMLMQQDTLALTGEQGTVPPCTPMIRLPTDEAIALIFDPITRPMARMDAGPLPFPLSGD